MSAHGVDRGSGAGGTGIVSTITAAQLAFATINEQTAETAPAAADEVLLADVSASALRKMTLENLLKVIALITSETAAATGDEIVIHDASASAAKRMTLENLFKVISALTEETSPAIGDLVALYDTSVPGVRKMTLDSILKVVNSLTALTELDGANDKLLVYDNSASAVRSMPAGVPFRKNAIINGDFNIWQRGTSFAAIANQAYSADRWQYGNSTSAAHTVSRSTDVPTVAQAGRLFNYSLLVDCTTADAAVAAGDIVYVRQQIEGYNWLPLAQKGFTISFWVKATKTGIYCVGFTNSGQDRSYTAEYTVNAANTWEKKTVTISASPSAGTWDYTNGVGLGVYFVLAAGSTYQAAAGSWTTSATHVVATANQVNACDNVANDFRICGVQLEPGSVATDFEQRHIQDEYTLCKRYFRAYGAGFDGTSDANSASFVSFNGSTTDAAGVLHFGTPMRVAPGITLSAASDFVVQTNAGVTAGTSVSVTITGTENTNITLGTGGGLTSGQGSICRAGNANARIYATAEF